MWRLVTINMCHMKYKLSFLLLSGTLFLSSCGSDASSYAEDLCDCMEESGYTDQVGLGVFSMGSNSREKREAEEKMQECALPILKEMRDDFKDMDDDEKKEFVKEFVKASIDTECSDQLMDNIPWALVMNGFKSLMERDGDLDFFGGEEEEMKEEPKYEYDEED